MRKLILTVIFGAALLALLNAVYAATGGDGLQREMRAQVERSLGRPTMVIGSSASRGIDLEAMCLDGGRYSYALDLFEAAAIARFILSRPAPPRTFLMVVSPTMELVNETTLNRRSTYRMLASFGDRRLIGGDWRRAFVANVVPVLGEGPALWQRMRVGLRLATEPTPDTEDDQMRLRLDPKTARRDADEWARMRADSLSTMAYYDPGIAERAMKALMDLDADIRASGGRMIVIILPVTAEVHSAMTATLSSDMRAFEGRVAQLRSAGVPVLDHLRDEAFVGRHQLFSDNLHLNRDGALLFSHQLKDSVASAGSMVAPAPDCVRSETLAVRQH